MPKENEQAPETQDTPPQLILGKYKTPEEAEAAHKEAERRMTEAMERADRAERLLSLLKPDPIPDVQIETQTEETDDDLDPDQKKAFEKMLTRALAEKEKDLLTKVGRAMNAREREQTERQKFFAENPDLVGVEDDVQLEAQKLYVELNGRALDDAAARKEVAKRVRERLGKIVSKFGKGRALHLEGGGSENPPKTSDDEDNEKMPSEDEILSAFIKDARERKNKKLVRG